MKLHIKANLRKADRIELDDRGHTPNQQNQEKQGWGNDREVQKDDHQRTKGLKSEVVQYAYGLMKQWGLAGKKIMDLFSDPQLKNYSYKIRTEVEKFLKDKGLLENFKNAFGNNVSSWFSEGVIAKTGKLRFKAVVVKIKTKAGAGTASPELLSAISERAQKPDDFDAFLRLYKEYKASGDLFNGPEGRYALMSSAGFIEKDIQALIGVEPVVTPEAIYVDEQQEGANKVFQDRRNTELMDKFGPDKLNLVKEVLKYAEEHYDEGWDTIVEAYDEAEIAEIIGDVTTPEEAIDIMRDFVQ